MADIKLTPITVLANEAPVVEAIGAVQIVEVDTYSLASVGMRKGEDKSFGAAAKKLLGITPPKPGQSASKGETTIFWSAQDQWFVEMPGEKQADIAAYLKSGFGDAASITEQTGGWCRFDLMGESVIAMLERLCMLDIAAMKAGAASRSVIEHISVFILCREAGRTFSVYGPSSMASSLHHGLVTAAKSVA